MSVELQPVTEAGARLVKLAEEHALDFAPRADEHDRDNTFPFENFEAMNHSGVLAACVPVEFGGMGVESLHDLTIAIGRLARGCAATAISANMHMAGLWNTARAWRASGDETTRAQMEMILPSYGRSEWVTCGIGTESGSQMPYSQTTATPVEGGYVINGRKTFCTNSEVAGLFSVFLRVPQEDADDLGGLAIVLRGAEGMEIQDNWDSLGMRASKSHDIVFRDCFVSKQMLFTWAWTEDPAPGLVSLLGVNYPLAGAFLGIAESARDHIVEAMRTRRKAPSNRLLAERPGIQRLVAEIEMDLATARAILERNSLAIDDYLSTHTGPELVLEEVHALFADWQCTKLVVQRAAIDVVDKALTASGGSGYMSGSPLSRHYRDVRAGPFMQPYSPVEAYEYIGKVALSLDPALDL